MEFKWGDSIWELMLTQRPSDTHFSQSSTPGGKNGMARDGENKLVANAVLYPGEKTVVTILVAGMVTGAAAMKVAPHVKSRLVRLKSKLSTRTEETSGVEAPIPLAVVAEISPKPSNPLGQGAV
jgi:2-keto-3-deoxy-galactonokinase